MKIALLFLCENDIHQLELWEKFLQNATPGTFNVYTHCYKKEGVTQAFVERHHVPRTVPSGWGKIGDLVKYMLSYALEQDSENYKFVLVSDSTIPIKPPDEVHRFLTQDERSLVNYLEQTTDTEQGKFFIDMMCQRYIYNLRTIPHFLIHVPLRHWYYNETWVVYNREHAKLLASDELYVVLFRKAYVSDENYPAFMLSLTGQLEDVNNVATTFVNWSEAPKEGPRHPKTYDTVTRDQLRDMRQSPGHLFARKFSKVCDLSLLYDYLVEN